MTMQTPLSRRASLFRNGRNQAVRIPKEWEFSGSEIEIVQDGDALILRPIVEGGLIDLLRSWGPLDEGIPEIEDLPPRDVRL